MNITILCMDITMFYRYKSSINRQFSRAMLFYCRGPRSFSEGGGAKMEEWLSNPMITGESCRSFPPFLQVSKYHVSKIQSNAQKKAIHGSEKPRNSGWKVLDLPCLVPYPCIPATSIHHNKSGWSQKSTPHYFPIKF